MNSPANPDLIKGIKHQLQQHDGLLTWVETHGLLCALSCGPQTIDNWQDALFIDESFPLPSELTQQLTQYQQRLASRLGLGDGVTLPCRLDPYQDDEGSDLTSWCVGFMAAVFCDPDAWQAADNETVAEFLLPFNLISGVLDDEEADTIWDNAQLMRQMAMGIPALLEELYLHFNAPDMPQDSGKKSGG